MSEGSALAARRVRYPYLVFGLLCTGLGIVGYIVPIMPGTVFLIMAVWAFKRSSPRMEEWLLHRSVFGPVLRDWEESRSMKLRTKILAIGMVWLAIGGSVASLVARHRPEWVSWMLVGIGLILTWFLATRRTTRS